ncbi:MAG: hypothetical protein GY870_07655, partial [archaeon]|nr:hypothetical protein [archaeon]
NRHKNPIWPLLSEDKISGLFITDGFHLPKDLILTGIKAKKISNFIVASDMMHLTGRKPGNYIINDIPIVLEENGYLHIKGSQQLSGSARNMMDCMNYLNSIVDLDESDIFKIGYENPLKLINKKIDEELLNQGMQIGEKGKIFYKKAK